ncbi:hypothetical protein CUMW_016870, partial [Citrus unshiu]
MWNGSPRCDGWNSNSYERSRSEYRLPPFSF